MLGEFEHPASSRDQWRQPGSHSLEERVTECFRRRGKREDVRGRIRRGEQWTVQETRHVYSRDTTAPYVCFERSPANQCQPGGPPLGSEQVPSLQQKTEILLARDAPDVRHEQIARLDPYGPPIRVAPKARMKTVRVDAAAPDARMGYTPAVEVLLVNTRRTEHPMALAVEPPQVAPAGTKHPVHPISGCILVVVRVGRGDDGHVQLAGNLEPCNTQSKLGRDVDYVGFKAFRILQHVAHPWKCPLNVGIQEQRHAGRAVHLRTIRLPPGESVRGGV